jgi:hypothetical protein
VTKRDKTITYGRQRYALDLHDKDFPTVAGEISTAMASGDVVEVAVLDEGDRRLTLYLNGAQLDGVVLDAGLGSRPSEPS